MDNSKYQKNHRRNKKKNGWRYFSVQVPPDFYVELKKFYIQWKMNNINKSDE
jgi:hypothetical protein